MKTLIFYFIIIIILSPLRGIAQSIKKQNSTGTDNNFEIWNIDSVQTVYIIYAKRNDSIIKIVSKKEGVNNCKPILKGQFYDLEVTSLLEHTASKRHIGGVKYNNILVKLEGDKVIWDLFTCDNFKGLCYTPTLAVECEKKRKRTRK